MKQTDRLCRSCYEKVQEWLQTQDFENVSAAMKVLFERFCDQCRAEIGDPPDLTDEQWLERLEKRKQDA